MIKYILFTIKFAFSNIWANKIRSFLTMLGVIIGVSSVITLMAIGQGVKNEVTETIEGIGSNFIFVLPGNLGLNNEGKTPTNSGGTKTSFGNPANLISGDILTRDDINEIKKLDNVQTAAAMSIVSGVIKKGDKIISPMLVGIDSEFKDVLTGITLGRGRFFTPEDAGKNVIVLGEDTRKQLFSDSEEPLGQKINLVSAEKKINQEFTIIGLLNPPATSSLFSNDLNVMNIIPLAASSQFTDGKEKIFRIGVKVSSEETVKPTAKKIRELMKSRHADNDVSVITQDNILDMMGTILNLMTAMVSGIAAISLIVGGVGIMNIMLVSVTERTREIGLRKAVGATKTAILVQFLIEAIVLTAFGAAIGLGLSYLSVILIGIYSPLSPVINWFGIGLAAAVSVGVGIIFGLFPAVKAAAKNPIDALRYE